MATHRIATFSVGGSTRYGAVVEGGMVDLSARFGKEYPTLREAIAGGALVKLGEDAARRSPDVSGSLGGVLPLLTVEVPFIRRTRSAHNICIFPGCAYLATTGQQAAVRNSGSRHPHIAVHP